MVQVLFDNDDGVQLTPLSICGEITVRRAKCTCTATATCSLELPPSCRVEDHLKDVSQSKYLDLSGSHLICGAHWFHPWWTWIQVWITMSQRQMQGMYISILYMQCHSIAGIGRTDQSANTAHGYSSALQTSGGTLMIPRFPTSFASSSSVDRTRLVIESLWDYGSISCFPAHRWSASIKHLPQWLPIQMHPKFLLYQIQHQYLLCLYNPNQKAH